MQSIEIGGLYFSSAHHLPAHERVKCRLLHGHTFLLDVTLYGSIRSANGNIAFYSNLSALLKDIIEPIDHKIILPKDSFHVDADMAHFEITINETKYGCAFPLCNIFVLPKPHSTIEYIAEYINENLVQSIAGKYPLITTSTVKLAETPHYSTSHTINLK